jgi:hypothetical protein
VLRTSLYGGPGPRVDFVSIMGSGCKSHLVHSKQLLNTAAEIVVTETYPVGASYEGVQADGDCSANPLGNYSQRA